VTVKGIAAGAEAESENVQKGARITSPATMAAARSEDVTGFPRSNMSVSYFLNDGSNLTRRILHEIVPRMTGSLPCTRNSLHAGLGMVAAI